MGARNKLNGSYFLGSCLAAGLVGGIMQSWIAFGVTLLVMLLANLVSGDIR